MTLSFNLSDKPESFGHHFIVGLTGPELSESDKEVLGRLKPLGIILLARNFRDDLPYQDWLDALRNLLKSTLNYVERDKLIVSIDHEGGRVHRTPNPITHFPSPGKYAQDVAKVARAMAIELKSLGVNLYFGPLADIHSNPKNPVIGDRSFGPTPDKVSRCAIDFHSEMAKAELVTCAKHFPGHGDTAQDSHHELPTLNLNEEQLANRELVPFKALIDAGIPMVMSAHILFSQIDQYYPATFSHKFLTGILRDSLGFNGVTISDGVDMHAVSKAFNDPDMIGKSVMAGCDMFICTKDLDPKGDRPLTLGKLMAKALVGRHITEARLHQSFNLINKLFQEQIKVHPVSLLGQEVLEEHADLARVLNCAK